MIAYNSDCSLCWFICQLLLYQYQSNTKRSYARLFSVGVYVIFCESISLYRPCICLYHAYVELLIFLKKYKMLLKFLQRLSTGSSWVMSQRVLGSISRIHQKALDIYLAVSGCLQIRDICRHAPESRSEIVCVNCAFRGYFNWFSRAKIYTVVYNNSRWLFSPCLQFVPVLK